MQSHIGYKDRRFHLLNDEEKHVKVGDYVTDFLGDPMRVASIFPPTAADGCGAVECKGSKYAPGAFSLRFVEVA